MPAHLNPHIYFVRFFSEESNFGDNYDGSLVITWTGDGETVEVDLASNSINKEQIISLYEQLLAKEVKFLIAYRKKGHRVPGGELIAETELFTVWKINLKKTLKRLKKE